MWTRLRTWASIVSVSILLAVPSITFWLYRTSHMNPGPLDALGKVQFQEPPGGDPEKPFLFTAEYNNPNVKLGVPGVVNATTRTAFPIVRDSYVISYNAETCCPNWVAWRLCKNDIGHHPRGAFEPDPILPKSFSKVTSSWYNNCGFDRGHMCPAKDRSATDDASREVFYMTNIVPQAPFCNQETWEHLEDHCRKLALSGKVLYIVCGPAGQGGEGTKGRATVLDRNQKVKVTVPAAVWKVIVVTDNDKLDDTARAIAVWVPNKQDLDPDWTKYRTSALTVQTQTGLHFFGRVPERLRDILLKQVDKE